MQNIDCSRRGIFLDMDGVVVDGMRYHVASWQHAFRKIIDIEVPPLQVYLTEGYKDIHVIPTIAKNLNLDIPPEKLPEMIALKHAYYQQIFQLKRMEGIQETLALIQRLGYSLALVTGADRKAAERALSEMDIRGQFDYVTSGDEVKQGKPSPEPYQKTAVSMGISPACALVVENAPAGIQSAKGAQMHCVALQTSLGAEYLSEADLVLPGHAALQELLEVEFQRSGGRGCWQLTV